MKEDAAALKRLPRMICVDPAPGSHLDVTPQQCGGLKPLCGTVDELIKLHPSLVDNCIVLCNWPSPNTSTYDYDAIVKLRPVHATFVIETTTGVAGGSHLHQFLHTLGVETGGHFGFSRGTKLELPKFEYKVAWETHREGIDVVWDCAAILSVVTVTRDASRVVQPEIKIPRLLPGSFELGNKPLDAQGAGAGAATAQEDALFSGHNFMLLALLLKQLQAKM
jgi:hypothetical protein